VPSNDPIQFQRSQSDDADLAVEFIASHCRAARGWLAWTQNELSDRSGVGLTGIRDFESQNRQSRRSVRILLQKTLQNAGVLCIPNGIEALPSTPPVGDVASFIHAGERVGKRMLIATGRITPPHCRASRGWLGWTQMELSKRSGVGLRAIRDFENELRQSHLSAMILLRDTFDDAAIRFTEFGIRCEPATSGGSDRGGASFREPD